jgi:hypothetical protein
MNLGYPDFWRDRNAAIERISKQFLISTAGWITADYILFSHERLALIDDRQEHSVEVSIPVVRSHQNDP